MERSRTGGGIWRSPFPGRRSIADPDRRRKAMTAVASKMVRVAHALVERGTEYRLFLERADTRWKDPSLCSREGAVGTL